MKETKRGIALITLLITLVVMAILATVIIMQVNVNKLFDKADNAVDKEDLQAVKTIAQLAWSDAYLAGKETQAELQKAVEDAFTENGINKEKYVVNVTEDGVKVEILSTLGALVASAADYGKTVDYTVTIDGVPIINWNIEGDDRSDVMNDVTLSDWQVLYEDEKNNYIFLISSNEIGESYVYKTSGPGPVLSDNQKNYLNDIFQLGKTGLSGNHTSSSLMYKWNACANKELYKNYVIGAIGGPTIELLAAGYNAYHNTEAIVPIIDTTLVFDEDGIKPYDGSGGYFLNKKGQLTISGLMVDGIYFKERCYYGIASPSAGSTYGIGQELLCAIMTGIDTNGDGGIKYRPVVCLASDIPATYGSLTDFSLVIDEIK